MNFLQDIANAYYGIHDDQICELTFVFPNRRAGLFFKKYLAQAADKPIFSPKIYTIDQLFCLFSKRQLVDPTELIFRLYQVNTQIRKELKKEIEPFDKFLFWGQMMLGDFNDIDMHCVDADKLYINLKQIKELETNFSYLTEEQKELINTFFKGFNEEKLGTFRENFLHFWEIMLPTYKKLKENLAEDNLAYQGMLSKEVIQEEDIIDRARELSNKYIFVGFNALSQVERLLMRKLKDADLAEFCWDYSHKYLKDENNRASLFIDENLKLFPQTTNIVSTENNNKPKIHLIEVPSSVGQANIVSTLLNNNIPDNNDWTQIGIVLPDEHLLQTILDNIPSCVDKLNITMGQPLSTTPIISLLQHLSELQIMCKDYTSYTMYYYKPVLALLSHPYIKPLITTKYQSKIIKSNMTYVSSNLFTNQPLLELIFTHKTQPADILEHLRQILLSLIETQEIHSKEKNEYIYQTLLQINKIKRLLQRYEHIQLTDKTLFSILIDLIKSGRIPYEGEPLSGLQIMGMLESRGMTFDKLIITDVNDDIIPGSTFQQTYIPYDLRIAHQLPTPDRQNAVVSYNFYRLLTNCQEAWLLTNNSANELRSGEPSRFVQQLIYQYGETIERTTINTTKEDNTLKVVQVEKTEQVIQELKERLCNKDKGLSASALNTYMHCPLKFYLEYVKSITEPDKISEDIASNTFGTIVHYALQNLYDSYNNQQITSDIIDSFIKEINKSGEGSLVDNLYHHFQLKDEEAQRRQLEGCDNIYIHVIKQYIKNVLEYDKSKTPFTYIGSEQKYMVELKIPQIEEIVRLNGVIDRIDRVDGELRIIDYKTGNKHNTWNKEDTLDTIFTSDKTDYDHTRQTLFYCLLYKLANPESKEDPHPHMFYVRNKPTELCSSIRQEKGDNTGFDYIKDKCIEAIQNIIIEILNPEIPIKCNVEENRCKYCSFKTICQS